MVLANYQAQEKFSLLLGGSLGLIFFLSIFGTCILHPQYVAWLLENTNQDSIQHFVGWEFFRNETWHFPLGAMQSYGYPIPTSIVYTDSIPILALIFKCFSQWLPENFQYFGFWYAFCFFMQGTFAWALSCYITKNNFIKCCITLFFLMSPIMLNRVMEDQSLVAQWLILAGFWLYIRPYRFNLNWFWLILITFAVLTHAYLAFMVFALWLAFLLRHILIDKDLSIKQSTVFFILTIFTAFLAAWTVGYFVIPFSGIIDAGGYGLNSMNLLAPFMPTTGSVLEPSKWSFFIQPILPLFSEQGVEGFNYFGMGILTLLVFSLACLIQKRPGKKTLVLWLPMIVVCTLLTLYAISNVIYIGHSLLFSYSLPQYSFVLTNMFRASGRFFWPAYYFLMLMTFIILNSRLKTQWLIFLLSASLVLQLVDLSIKIKGLHQYFATYRQVRNPQNASREVSYSRMVFLPPISMPNIKIKNFGDYIHYAATHHMTVNLGYFARQDNSQYMSVGKQLLIQASQGQFSKDTLYIIIDPHLARMLKMHLHEGDMVATLNSYTVILPALRQ
ncbi:MAG: hypothetical protein HKM04_02660 [Legionellales bacterium]|nr:hypothetical protein [Legionellales bacterium]